MVYKELIEKIRLVLNCSLYSEKEKNTSWRFGFEEAIDQAMKIIKASEPPELDAPNEEGWWWFEEEGKPVQCVNVTLFDNHLSCVLNWDIRLVECLDGKWQKAIVPK